MDIGGVSPSAFMAVQLANPAATTAGVAAIVAARPDLVQSPAAIAGQVAQQLAAHQATRSADTGGIGSPASGYPASGAGDPPASGVLDVYA